jgi:anti-sigma factor RsiW
MSELKCEACQPWLHAYLDNELDAATAARVQTHLTGCAHCRAALGAIEALRDGVRAHLPYHAAPADLRRRVLAHARRELRPPAPRQALGWLRWAAPAFSTVALALAAMLYLATPSPGDLLSDEFVSSHVRSLLEQHLADVASSDRHTVKPWFTGKLDFSPPVYDFTTEGYPLLGGRIDYIADRTVAALVYRHRKHIINVFVMPTAQADTGLRPSSRRGFNLVSWREHHLAFEAVSDLSQDDLEALCRLIQSSQQERRTVQRGDHTSGVAPADAVSR